MWLNATAAPITWSEYDGAYSCGLGHSQQHHDGRRGKGALRGNPGLQRLYIRRVRAGAI